MKTTIAIMGVLLLIGAWSAASVEVDTRGDTPAKSSDAALKAADSRSESRQGEESFLLVFFNDMDTDKDKALNGRIGRQEEIQLFEPLLVWFEMPEDRVEGSPDPSEVELRISQQEESPDQTEESFWSRLEALLRLG